MEIKAKMMSLGDYFGQNFKCDCGRLHSTEIKAVEIEKDAMHRIPNYLSRLRLQNAYVVCDTTTYEIAGEKVIKILGNAGIATNEHIFVDKPFVPDEKAVGELLANMDGDCDVVIAVGTGSINDIVRLFSFKIGRPFIIVATATPMDGFASSIAAVFMNDFKTTFEAQTPSLIIGDTDILKNAPIPMITAGLGDILGKFTCLCDWKLSKLINNEYYCQEIVDMVEISVQQVYKNAYKINERDSAVIGLVMEALVLAGVAASFVGNSRPISGCEHHISHYWEMIFIQRGSPALLHGMQVGLATIVVLKIAELLTEHPINFEAARSNALAFDLKKWETKIRKVYGPASDEVISLERKAQKNNIEKRLKRIDIIEFNWNKIRDILVNDLPPIKEMIDLLKHLEMPYFPGQKGIDNKMLRNTIIYGKETRDRYTILQMVWDLGLSEYMADKLVDYMGTVDKI